MIVLERCWAEILVLWINKMFKKPRADKQKFKSSAEESGVKNISDQGLRQSCGLWEEYDRLGIKVGHGGMDWHVLRAFVEGIKEGHESPIDVYDAAVLLAVTPLSEDSIALGGAPVAMPDFTNGEWVKKNEKEQWKYSL